VHIAIDATPLLVRSAGVKNYLYHWITHLRRGAGRDSIRTFPRLGHLGPLDHNGSITGRFRTATGLGALALSNYTPVPVLDWLTGGADVFHASVLVRHPPRRVRLTATIHDMTAWTLPELHPAGNRRAESSFAGLARAADRLIAVSQCTKDDAVRVLRLSEDKITVIHSGIADAFFDPSPAAVESVRARYKLSRPFVLFVGTIEPRKNVDLLIAAFNALPQSIRAEHEMVVAGPMGWAAPETRARLQSVRYLGYVAEEDLAPLTAAATVFVYPSLYEGFGFPVAQAMAAAVPVITSNVSSLPEIGGEGVLLVDPRSENELRDALARLLTTPDLRAQVARRGRARAEQFRWTACAARSWEFFRSM
jgi:glycosyltransferase involved in cell wall biosynthesis